MAASWLGFMAAPTPTILTATILTAPVTRDLPRPGANQVHQAPTDPARCAASATAPSSSDSWPSASVTASPAKTARRTKFSEEDDVFLLHQVQLDLPFTAKRGSAAAAWDGVAQRVLQVPAFSREYFSGNKSQNRFLVLLEKHKAYDRASARGSGVSEPYFEKSRLLDELAAFFESQKKQDAARGERELKEKQQHQGQAVRDSVISTLGKRKKANDQSKNGVEGRGKFTAMAKMFAADIEAENKHRIQEIELKKQIREDNKLDLHFR